MLPSLLILKSSDVNTGGHRLIRNDDPVIAVLKPDAESEYATGETFCTSCGVELKWRVVNPEASEGEFHLSVNSSCEYPNPGAYQIKLSVPSGKIVFADNLWAYGVPQAPVDYEAPSYSTPGGRKFYAESLEKEGIAYGAVLNTSPEVLLEEATGSIKIATREYDEPKDEFVMPAGHRRIGDIDTDLWAYCFMDYEDFLSRGGSHTEEDWIFPVDVKPGVYTFTHYADTPGFDHEADGFVLFAEATYSPFE